MTWRATTRAVLTLRAGIALVLLLPGLAAADVLVSWDWNDGTTQGWTASTQAFNVGGQLQAINVGNGALQMFGPRVLAEDLLGLTTVSFDLTITTYTCIPGGPPTNPGCTVMSPSDLTISRLDLLPPIPGRGFLHWDFDLSGLAFGESRTFTLSIDDAVVGIPLQDAASFSLLFAAPDFGSNSSSGLLDNFVVSGARVPQPSAVLLLGVGLVGLWVMERRQH